MLVGFNQVDNAADPVSPFNPHSIWQLLEGRPLAGTAQPSEEVGKYDFPLIDKYKSGEGGI